MAGASESGHWAADYGYRELIERADAMEAAQAERAIAALKRKLTATEADYEAARLDAKVKRFRTDNYLKHARMPNTIGRMLMALGIIHSNLLDLQLEQRRGEAAAPKRRIPRPHGLGRPHL